MIPTYYNTNGERGDQLRESKIRAGTQEAMILRLFELSPDEELTPFQVQRAVFKDRVPVTSVRRAMTNLTKRGLLEKTDRQRRGRYGKKNYCWRLAVQPGQMEMFSFTQQHNKP